MADSLLLTLFIAPAGVILLYIFKVILAFRKQKQANIGVPSTHRHWFFGNATYYSGSEKGLRREFDLMKKFKKCYQKWFGYIECIAMSYHPDIVKPLLSSNEPKSKNGHRFFFPWIGDGLLTSNGEKWKRNRRLLTPIFHFHSLQRYVPCFNDAAMTMMQKWKTANLTSFEMFNDVSVMSLDILLRCMFSKDSGCDSGMNLNYLKAVKAITEEIAGRRPNPFYHFDFIYFLTAHGKKYKTAVKVAHDFTENAIQERLDRVKNLSGDRCNASEPDFLDVLLMARDENGRGLTHKEIRDELDTFVFEGHDTVTSGISWAMYNLAVHPEHQQICRNEVMDVLEGGNRVEWRHLSKFQYLTKFIKESMRIYPPVGQVGRQIRKPMSFSRGFESQHRNVTSSNIANGNFAKTFPPNSSIAIKISMLHRNPAIWENPDEFDPERFNPANAAKRSPHAYVPFSTGPRNCIGQNFAMNEMKVVLAMALSMFKFKVDTSYPKPEMNYTVILGSKTGIHLLVENI